MQRRVVTTVTSPLFSWRKVRAQIWVKAEQLFMMEQMRTMDCDVTPERSELREGGYFERAKIIVLRNGLGVKA